MAGRTRSATRAAEERDELAAMMEEVAMAFVYRGVLKNLTKKERREAEFAMHEMAQKKCGTVDLISAAAGQAAGAAAAMEMEETYAESEFLYLSEERGMEGESSFGLRSPIGLHVREVESPPTTVQDVEKSEYREVWSSAMRAELNGHETAGTFSSNDIPKNVNIITAKWVFSWKTDSRGLITKAKARLVARGFGQRFAVDYFETFAATPAMTSIKLVMAVAVQEGWPLYHLDVKQAFIRAKMDTDVYMKLPPGCGQKTDTVVRLEKAIYGVKQAGRQWSLLLNKTLIEEAEMVQSKADPCVYKRVKRGSICAILVVHVDDILIGGEEKQVEEICAILNRVFPTNNLGEVQWYMGCAIERDWKKGTMRVDQTTFIDTLLKRFDITNFSDLPAAVSVSLGPVKKGEVSVARPYRNAVGGLMWLAQVTRPDIANVTRELARQSHHHCERHWRGVLKVLAYLHQTREYGLTFRAGASKLSVYCDADYAKREDERRSVSGVAVMYGGIAVSCFSRTQHCVTLSTTEAEYVAMAEGAKECMFVRSVLSFLRPKVVLGREVDYDIVLFEDNEGAKALADNPLSSGRSKHIDVRWHFIRDLVRNEEVIVKHVDSEWQAADILTKPLPLSLFKRHRRVLMNLGENE